MIEIKEGDIVLVKTSLGVFRTTCISLARDEIAIDLTDLFPAEGRNWSWVPRRCVEVCADSNEDVNETKE